jgi:hypothetical protein
MVLAADPGVPGYAPRVWVYRNTIKALNWYSSVREKLDDPKYSSWFTKFKGFRNTPYPGGLGWEQNGSFHVPTCDWYDNGTKPRCSGFWHDQKQTPEHSGGGKSYPVSTRRAIACRNACVLPDRLFVCVAERSIEEPDRWRLPRAVRLWRDQPLRRVHIRSSWRRGPVFPLVSVILNQKIAFSLVNFNQK